MPNWKTVTNTWYECVEHTQTYPDFLDSAQVSVSLTQASRNWILNNLAQAYPGAHLLGLSRRTVHHGFEQSLAITAHLVGSIGIVELLL